MSKNLQEMVGKRSVYRDDFPLGVFEDALSAGLVSIDIETSGLNWKEDKLLTIQLYVPDSYVYIVQVLGNTIPSQLESILSSPDICKVFHHALFDLRFLVNKWNFQLVNIACTKIASKILAPEISHSLANLLRHFLNVSIDKSLQVSDWSRPLSEAQLDYAVRDVLYLPALLALLKYQLEMKKLWGLTEACFDFIPAQVELDIRGYTNLFNY